MVGDDERGVGCEAEEVEEGDPSCWVPGSVIDPSWAGGGGSRWKLGSLDEQFGRRMEE